MIFLGFSLIIFALLMFINLYIRYKHCQKEHQTYALLLQGAAIEATQAFHNQKFVPILGNPPKIPKCSEQIAPTIIKWFRSSETLLSFFADSKNLSSDEKKSIHLLHEKLKSNYSWSTSKEKQIPIILGMNKPCFHSENEKP
jgi:hypothetical protein